jgi:hypothetical protein
LAPPTPVLYALTEQRPQLLHIEVKSFDEGWNFACHGTFEGGSGDLEDVEPTKRFAREVYAPTHGEEDE